MSIAFATLVFTEGFFALEFCLVARIVFIGLRALGQLVLLLCSNVSSLFSQLPACQCALFQEWRITDSNR